MIYKSLKTLLFIFICFLSLPDALSSDRHLLSPYSITIQNGLKSNNIHDIHIDRHGRLWIASSMGLSLYNGYQCKNYTLKDGLPENDVHEMFEDEIGRLWLITNSSKLAYIEKDSLFEYPFNHLITEFKKRRSDLHTDFFVDANNLVRLSINTIGKLIINKSGEFQIDKKSIKSEEYKSQYIEEIGNNKYFFYTEDVEISPRYRIESHNFLKWKNGNENLSIQKRDLTLCYFDYAQFGDTTFMSIGKYLHVIYNERIIESKIFESSIISITIHNATILLSMHSNGVKSLDLNSPINSDWKSNLDNITCTKIIPAKNNGYWVSTIGYGVLFISNLNDSHLHVSSKITSIALKDNTLLLSNEKGWVFNIKTLGDLLKSDSTLVTSLSIDQIISTTKETFIRSSKKIYLIDENNHMIEFQCPENNCNIKNLSKDENDNITAFGNSIYKISNNELNNLTNRKYRTYFTDIQKVGHQTFVSAIDGLYFFSEDSLIYLGSLNKKLKHNMTCLASFNDQVILIGTNGNGLMLYDVDDENINSVDETFESFNHISFIQKISEKKFIIRSGTNILEIIFKNNSSYELKWIQPFYDILSLSDEILVQNSNIFTFYENEALRFDYSSIFLQLPPLKLINPQIWINNKSSRKNQNLTLKHDQNNVLINVETIRLFEGNELVYKYKLHNTDIEWLENKGSAFLFENLPSGEYQINIKANTLNDRLESNVIVLFINIKPPLWRSWWLLLLCTTTIIYISKMIINQLKEKEKRKNLEKIYINDKIVAIELSALKGQINSHFIFNILNGIKSLLVDNNNKDAINYLVKFSTLLRDVINNTFKRTISLEGEIDSIKNYIQLENMRFKEKIEVSIYNVENLDFSQIRIPSFILQPFVENSIIHGFKNKSLHKKIDVSISTESSLLIIKIRDNGVGRENLIDSSKEHIGFSNTKRRLEIVNQLFGYNHVSVMYFDHKENGKSTGTEVVLKIKN